MRTFFDRLTEGVELDKIIMILETIEGGQKYANQLRDLHDRIRQGPPVMASDLDIERFLAVDMLIAARRVLKIPPDRAFLSSIEHVALIVENASSFMKDLR